MLAKKKVEEGAPAWTLTYGDMMSLLLCFFILLSAFADYDKGGGSSASVIAAMQSIQQALGIKTQKPFALNDTLAFNSMLEQIQKAIQDYEVKNRSDTSQQGLQGKSFRLVRIRDGMEITIGGPVLFEPFSGKLTQTGRESLEGIASIVKGHRNKIDIVGHASEQPTPSDWTHNDAMELSHTRARCVADELIGRGVDPRVMRLVAVGANEPIRRSDTTPGQAGDSRRVEIVVRESMIDDYRAEKTARTPENPGPAGITAP